MTALQPAGEASHYRFLVAETNGKVAGYACWGPIPGTVAAADEQIAEFPDFYAPGDGKAVLMKLLGARPKLAALQEAAS